MRSTSELAEGERFYMPELDGLRFFAFLAVFLSHVALFSDGAATVKPVIIRVFDLVGRFGVSLFFTLSAYLLTVVMIREKEKFGRLRAGAFYMRRLLRIWPLYFFWLAVLILTRRMWSDYSVSFFIPLLLFAGNFQAAFSVVSNIVVLPLWSLSVEEQFYLIWPMLVSNLTRRGLVVAGIAIWVMSTAVRFDLLWHGYTPHQIWFTGFARLGSFAAGILIAVMMERPVRFSRWLIVLFGLVCWAEASTCHLYLSQPEGIGAPMVGYPMATMGSAAFLVAAIGVEPGRLLTSRPMVYLGRISYGLYVFHSAALVIVSRLIPPMSNALFWPLFILAGFLLALAVSAASYRFIESPFLRLKKRYELVHTAPVIGKMAA